MLQLDTAAPPDAPAEELAVRLEADGYLVLPSPEAVGERIGALWLAADAFFQLPREVRSRNSLDNEDGWHATGRPSADDDRAESFHARLEHAHDTWRFPDPAGRTLHRAALDAAAVLEALLRPITHILAQHYAGPGFLPEHAFVCDDASHLQLSHYPPHERQRELFVEEPRGGRYLTLLVADGPGLEVLTRAGRWLAMQPSPGELIAVPGEIFSRLCGNRVQPLPLRRRCHPRAERRYTMVYVANPSPTAILRPWCAPDSASNVETIARSVASPISYGLPPLPVT
jgi:isopenicillin N synthase-like dioxygenase